VLDLAIPLIAFCSELDKLPSMKDGSQTDHVAERNLILILDLESLTYDLDFSFPGELQS